jgi:hypothetical protein
MPKFMLGKLVWTRGVNDKIAEDEDFPKFVWESLKRHKAGDWGDLCEEDWRENNKSLRQGFRIFSAYQNGKTKIWIITEATRSYTTVLFPEEY